MNPEVVPLLLSFTGDLFHKCLIDFTREPIWFWCLLFSEGLDSILKGKVLFKLPVSSCVRSCKLFLSRHRSLVLFIWVLEIVGIVVCGNPVLSLWYSWVYSDVTCFICDVSIIICAFYFFILTRGLHHWPIFNNSCFFISFNFFIFSCFQLYWFLFKFYYFFHLVTLSIIFCPSSFLKWKLLC